MASGKSTIRAVLATLAVVAVAPLIVILLPVLLPIIAASVAWDERRMARTPCPNCGQAFGRGEVQRAKRAAHESAHNRMAAFLPHGLRRRVVPIWHLICPNCGFTYRYRSGDPPGALTPLGPAPSNVPSSP